jgi:dihydroorotase-like cyclic amidohydrolase
MSVAASREPAPILIRNAYVVPGAHRPHLDRADILVEGNGIAAIGPDRTTRSG